LRALLNVILGHAQLLALNTDLDESSRAQVREIEAAGRALMALVEPLLTRSQAGAEPPSRRGGDGPASADGAPPSVARPRRILVAEDHPPNQAVLRMQLELLGYAADIVGDGNEALIRWRTGQYGLILADLHMPGLNGRELARAVREQERIQGGRVPIVAITASAASEERAACRAAGMDEILFKPVKLDALGNTLRHWLAGTGPVPEPSVVVGGAAEQLLDLFVGVARRELEEAGRLLRKRDGSGVADIMHKLKSSGRSLGAELFARLAVELEKAARSGLDSGAGALLAEMESALKDFEAAAVKPPENPAQAVPDDALSAEDIRQAIQLDEFEVLFQPELGALDGWPVAAVAEARWRSRRHGVVCAPAFQALAERHNLVGPLSELLFSKALFGGAQLAEAGFPLDVVVPLSPVWLMQPQLPEFIQASLCAARLPAERVALEVSEAGAMAMERMPKERAARLLKTGVRFALDDFGPEGSSPERLKRIGFSRIKLSRDALRGASDEAFRAFLMLSLERAKALGFAIEAKGLETPEDLGLARSLGCEQVQGRVIGAALSVEALTDWLATRQKS
jgi:EAL domain-containing protein (putative c-di-GMP-specific phosphodiesterase class I)/response regulator of citrate/malate metabolism